MQDYVDLPSGHMEYLIRALDGDPRGLVEPVLPPLPVTPDQSLVHAATTFLRRPSLPIEPRKQWPVGGMPRSGLSGRIASEHQAEIGRALSVWGDAGWGGLVREGKYRDGEFCQELVEACAEMVRDWDAGPAPTWVTCIPSSRYPGLVPEFAGRLAAILGLPFHAVLARVGERPEQKTMANSAHQARNVDGSMTITGGQMPAGPVLLVDDMVDSRWTLTVAAWLLRTHGSGQVYPLALALTGPGA